MEDFLVNCYTPIYKILECCKGVDLFEFGYKKNADNFKIIITKDYGNKEEYIICIKDKNEKIYEYHADLKKLSKYNFNELFKIISGKDIK